MGKGNNVTVSADKFGAAIYDMIQDEITGVEKKLPRAVKAACKSARDEARENAQAKFEPYFDHGKPYYKSLKYSVDKSTNVVEGVVGSEEYPGLVHLLEKGHVTIGGGWVNGRSHMAEGYEAGVDAFMEEINKIAEE